MTVSVIGFFCVGLWKMKRLFLSLSSCVRFVAEDEETVSVIIFLC